MTLRPQVRKGLQRATWVPRHSSTMLVSLRTPDTQLLRCQFGRQKASKPPSTLHRYWSDGANKGHWKQDRWDKLDKVATQLL